MTCFVGCGVDIEERNRFTKHIIENKYSSLIERIFTPKEIQLNSVNNSVLNFALGFSCKESVFKALGVSWTNSPIQWTDIELLFNDKQNIFKYKIELNNYAAQLFKTLGGTQLISNFEYNNDYVFFQVQIIN